MDVPDSAGRNPESGDEHVAGTGPRNKRAEGGVLQKHPIRQNEPVPGASSGGFKPT